MSGQDTKPKWSLAAPKARFNGGAGLKLGNAFRSHQKPMGPTPGLEDVVFVANLPPARQLLQYRDNMEKMAMYVGREYGGIGGPQAATAIRKRADPLGVEPTAPTGNDATPGSVEMIKWKVL